MRGHLILLLSFALILSSLSRDHSLVSLQERLNSIITCDTRLRHSSINIKTRTTISYFAHHERSSSQEGFLKRQSFVFLLSIYLDHNFFPNTDIQETPILKTWWKFLL